MVNYGMNSGSSMERPAVALVLTALVAYGPLSTDLYLPSLPAMTEAFGTGVSSVQLTLSVFMWGFAVAQLIYGPLSDRLGRRPVLLGGLVLYVLASMACVLADSIATLIAARFLQALGACAGPVLGRAIVRDIYGRERAARALSFMASGMALVPAVAPILGGWLHAVFGWRANFAAMAGFGALVLLSVWLILAETNRWRDAGATGPRRILRNFIVLLGHREFVGHSLSVAFSFAALFSVISGLSFVVIDVLGVAERNFGYVFLFVVAGYITGTFTSGRLSLRLPIERLIRAGGLIGMAAGLAMAALAWAGVERIWAVMIPASFVFMAAGLVMPNGMAGAIGPFPAMAGAASSLLGFLQMGLAAVGGYLVGLFHDGTTLPMAVVVLICTVLTSAAHGLLAHRAGADPASGEET